MTAIERIGTSDVYLIPRQDYVGVCSHYNGSWGRIRIPMPPSTNDRLAIGYKRFTRGGRAGMTFRPSPYLRLSGEARAYYGNAYPLRMAWKKIRPEPFKDYTRFRFYFFLGNMRYDTHNGLKLVCDLIEKSGLVVNDNLILPEIMKPIHAKDDPRLLIEFPLNNI